MSESRIEIPLPPVSEADASHQDVSRQGVLVGILRQQQGVDSTEVAGSQKEARPIALILHGVLAHKDQLFHRKLAAQLPIDSLRFDFRHAVEGGESRKAANEPAWDMANFADDVIELHAVVRHLRQKYNYHVELIVAHSRGTLDSWTYYWDLEQRRRGAISNRRDEFILDRAPLLVAIAGRWDMTRMRRRGPHAGHDFASQAWFDWKARVAGKHVSVRILPDMIKRFADYPIQDMVRSFPSECDVLLIHGDKDATVPVDDAYAYKTHLDRMQSGIYARQERPTSTQLKIIDGADHTFRGHFDAVVDATCGWYQERRALVTSNDPQCSPEEKAFKQRLQQAARGTDKDSGTLLSTWSTEDGIDKRSQAATSTSKL